MCIVLVTLGSAFVYYWAFIRSRRDKATGSQIDGSVHGLSTVKRVQSDRPLPRHCSPRADDQVIIRRPTPTPPLIPAANSQRTSNSIAISPSIHAPHFILPGPPSFPSQYVMHQQPILVPVLPPVALPSPPMAPELKLTSYSGPPQRPGPPTSRHNPRPSPTQPREPSLGHASTVSNSSSARGRPGPPFRRLSKRDANIRPRSRSSSLGTESRTRFEDLVARSGITEPVSEINAPVLKTPGASNRSTHRHHTSDSRAQEKQPRSACRRVQSVSEPPFAARRPIHDVLSVGETRVGREHRRGSRSRCQPLRTCFISSFFSAGESYVGRQRPTSRISREDHRGHSPVHTSARKSLRDRNSAVGRDAHRGNPSGDRLYGPHGAPQSQNIRGSSPAQSCVSSTGAICSFDDSDQHQKGSSKGCTSQRYRRSLSSECDLGHPRRVLNNSEDLVGPWSTDPRDLSLASEQG